jgi:hypothetical protein
MRRNKGRLLLSLAMGLVTGCASYYRVADPASGKVYYTRHVQQSGSSGFVKFEDAKSGAEITLQSSEVAEISEYEYKKGMSEGVK